MKGKRKDKKAKHGNGYDYDALRVGYHGVHSGSGERRENLQSNMRRLSWR
jgi:hypothetical protein